MKKEYIKLIMLCVWMANSLVCAADEESNDGGEEPPPPEQEPTKTLPQYEGETTLEEVVVRARPDEDPPPEPFYLPPEFMGGGGTSAGGGGFSGPKDNDNESRENESDKELPRECDTPYPVSIGSGNKHTSIDIFNSPSGAVKFQYNRSASLLNTGLGPAWFSNFDRRLVFTTAAGACDPGVNVSNNPCTVSAATPSSQIAFISRIGSDGNIYKYKWNATSSDWRSESARIFDKVVRLADGKWQIAYLNGSYEIFNQAGLLEKHGGAQGTFFSFAYAGNKLSTVSDHFGRQLAFQWLGQFLSGVQDHNGRVYPLTYQNGMLKGYTTPDGTPYEFHYQQFSGTLKGVQTTLQQFLGLSINGARYTEAAYYPDGHVQFSGLVNGIDRYSFAYSVRSNGDKVTSVESPLHHKDHYIFRTIAGAPLFAGIERDAGVGCSAAVKSQEYDANGNTLSYTTFGGRKTCLQENTYGLEQIQVEGLQSSAACPAVIASGATLPAGSHKITVEYVANSSLVFKRATPRRKTTYVYNGQPDPFNNNQIANCTIARYGATSVPDLPDGRPIAVLCKAVEQATTDVNGRLGLNAPLDTSAPMRTWSATYNQFGQILTTTDARGNTTTYAYYNDTSFTGADPNALGHTKGDLQSVTNAAGHLTRYPYYGKAGHLLREIDPNGLVTSYSYTPRGWLASVSRGGKVTSFDYWPNGLLKKVAFPSGANLNYTYDDAHRLTDIVDGKGNSIHYTLDALGNRTQQDVKDPTGVLARTRRGAYDALGRLQKSITPAQ